MALRAFGHFTYEANSLQPTPETLFDLASVTKVVATTAMAMLLYQRGVIDLEMPVTSIVGEFAGEDPRRDEVTLRMLLAHSSGLPAYEKLFLRTKTRDELLSAAFTTPLAHDPGQHSEYSDIGFIILGVALERLADETLDRFCQREVFGPLAMNRTTFNPAPDLHSSIPPTAEDQTFRKRIIQGEVQDENASVLGGVAGHAGLFSTSGDLAIFAHALLRSGGPNGMRYESQVSVQRADANLGHRTFLRPETLSVFTHRVTAPEESCRALGWDTPSSPSQSGKYFSPNSYGHLGYTGSSLWIDPDRQLSITLLTNRTWPDGENKAIQKIRPLFHDKVMEALSATKARPSE